MKYGGDKKKWQIQDLTCMFLKEQIFLRILGFITNNLRYRERETSKTNTMEDASTDEEGRSTKKRKRF